MSTRPKTRDRQTSAAQCDGSGMVRITDEEDPVSGYGLITASCGWEKFHRRKKVREDAAEAHAVKKHGGLAMWM